MDAKRLEELEALCKNKLLTLDDHIRFIDVARWNIPELIAEVRRLQEENAALKDDHQAEFEKANRALCDDCKHVFDPAK